MSNEFQLAEMVHTIVSSSNDVVKEFDDLLEKKNPVDGSPSEFFAIPREYIENYRQILIANSLLNKNLYEELQQILDKLNQTFEEMKKENTE